MVEKYIIDKSDIHKLLTEQDIELDKGSKARAFLVKIQGNSTNGDMIKAMFPQVVVTSEERATIRFYVDDEDGHTLFTGCMPQYVWNAPYRR